VAIITASGIRYVDRPGYVPAAADVATTNAKQWKDRAREARETRPRQKNEPKYVAMARELRDRYLEEVNSGRLLPAAPEVAKYEVGRAGIERTPTLALPRNAGEGIVESRLPLLEAA
jgi:hypothetical protein